MSTSVSAILDLHDARHSQDRSLAAILALAADHPEQLGALLLLALQRGSPTTAYLDVALDLLPDAALPPVCAEAWRRDREGASAPLVVRVVEFASYQAPRRRRPGRVLRLRTACPSPRPPRRRGVRPRSARRTMA